MPILSYLHVVICIVTAWTNNKVTSSNHMHTGNYILRRQSTATWAKSPKAGVFL